MRRLLVLAALVVLYGCEPAPEPRLLIRDEGVQVTFRSPFGAYGHLFKHCDYGRAVYVLLPSGANGAAIAVVDNAADCKKMEDRQ
jgi:hypothetical protein